MSNDQDIPVYELLRVSMIYGLNDEVRRMAECSTLYSNKGWKTIVHERAWVLEDEDWQQRVNMFKICTVLCQSVED